MGVQAGQSRIAGRAIFVRSLEQAPFEERRDCMQVLPNLDGLLGGRPNDCF